jgi:ATP-dependent DNA helicase DinG
MNDIEEVLGQDGLLTEKLPGFSPRTQQLEMAQLIATAMKNGDNLITEAGTGTGKTFAYLVPALLSGLKVVISTGTKNLQDQLYHRDLPQIRDALALPIFVALLKGRANYLCPHRLALALEDYRKTPPLQREELMKVRSWATTTKSGDLAELSGIPEDTPIKPMITSTTDNCLGQECPSHSDCYLLEARRRAQEADIVVVNHHLLCADLALKEEGFGEILPGADCFILDEAHQLPDVATSFFGLTVSGKQLLDLARDSENEYRSECNDLPELLESSDALKKSVRDLRLAFGLNLRRGSWQEIEADEAIVRGITKMREELDSLNGVLELLAGRSKGLDSCHERCSWIAEQLTTLCDHASEEGIRWFETMSKSFRLNQTPLDIAEVFNAQMTRHPASWIFTSATLAIGDDFSHFSRQLGIEDAESHRWDSPFDYANQALWYVPKGIPDPRNEGFTQSVAELAESVIEASSGRTFLLFTSHRALRLAADYLEDKIAYPMLVQGAAPRSELLEEFARLGNAVLLGTSSFWEGVDVRGEALSCVIIDKLPFASPGDPVLQARIDAMRKNGDNPFMEYQVPQAVIALKQGAGRLIRDVSDRGVLVLCDPRLLTKPYGKLFINSLPPLARTRDLEAVQAFFH